MLNKKIWNEVVKEVTEELKLELRENEEIVMVPTIIRTDDRERISRSTVGDFTNAYYRKINPILIKEDIEFCNKND